jgi:2-dehydro-3-deoxygluconokinase
VSGGAEAGALVTLGETMGLLAPVGVGALHHAGDLRLSIAGAESNVAIGVCRLGGRAVWMGRVGRDEIGELILRELRAEGVTVVAVDDAAPTGLMLKTRRTTEITRVSYFRSGSAGSRLSPEDVDEDRVRAAGVLHVTGITPALGAAPAAAVRAAVETARSCGVPVSFDLNYRAALWDRATASNVLRDLVKHADIVFAAEHEAALVVDADTPEHAARALAGLGPGQAVVKLGARGSVAVIDGAVHHRAAIPVRALDPVGAGDAFAAGYLSELLNGASPARRLATATASGAFAVTVAGDWEGLPRRDELALLDVADDVVR